MLVVKYAKMLADKLHADKEIIDLAALLHDIGVKDSDDIHERVGAVRAEKILRELKYPEETIQRVKECILTHRTSGRPKNKEAEIIRNADAMAHISALPFLIKIKSDRGSNLDDAIEWVKIRYLLRLQRSLLCR
ncbi:MAG: HD domain-containing protein [Candidatus Aenigmarchaeota archaeon]|nr:HD domain-containing protein [Candidatus Aenigmarchaeota archaeon]